MIDVDKIESETISDILNQGNQITDVDLNNLCYWFSELLEASLFISYEMCKEAEHNKNMKMKIQSEGFDKVIQECHKGVLELKKKYKWDSNIGEELI